MARGTIESLYKQLSSTPSDINEHLPTLKDLASECATVCECGVRAVVSTWALLQGLIESNEPGNKKLFCVDIRECPGINRPIQLAKDCGIDVKFIMHDSATLALPVSVDMLFIDTWHVYAHLKRELAHHHTNVKKYIVMHDTEVNKTVSESVMWRMNIHAQAQSSGYPIEEIEEGLQRAIDEFLAQDGDQWELYKVYTNNNGLTILRRKP